MKSLLTASVTALLLATTPAWAGGGHDRGKHWNKHAQKQWNKQQKKRAQHQRHYREQYVVRHHAPPPRVVHHYYAPPPRLTQHYHYAAPRVYAPPPGVHVVLPGIFLPF